MDNNAKTMIAVVAALVVVIVGWMYFSTGPSTAPIPAAPATQEQPATPAPAPEPAPAPAPAPATPPAAPAQ